MGTSSNIALKLHCDIKLVEIRADRDEVLILLLIHAVCADCA
jgi:hypothetical protein